MTGSVDVKVEVYKNASLVASGITRCIRGLVKKAARAQEIEVAFDPFDPVSLESGDVLSLKVLTRIGTTLNDARCSGPGAAHSTSEGLRLYYDSAGRESHFDATIDGDSADVYLHSDGGARTSNQSAGVTRRFLNSTAPAALQARCKDSGKLNFIRGNPWHEVGTWSMAPLP